VSYQGADPVVAKMSASQLDALISKTEKDMHRAAKAMEFMEAARLRDELFALQTRREEMTG
jgi:excinuclease ABC subunit B